jgi:Polysaccharide pyruvyl transferase.
MLYKSFLVNFLLFSSCLFVNLFSDGLPFYYYREPKLSNFGDVLSLKIVERIVGESVRVCNSNPKVHVKKLLAVGSIMSFARDTDVIWGSGVNGKLLAYEDYHFKNIDVRAVRGPKTRQFLQEVMHVECPEIYGDPALLMPYLFPEFKRSDSPKYDYIIIPHYRELALYPKELYPNVVYPTDPWEEVLQKILDSSFVIASSMHGIIVAEAYGIPARLLPPPPKEFLFKYEDYYLGSGRETFTIAQSVEEALLLGGEPPVKCDLKRLYEAFPFEFWPGLEPKELGL